MKGWAIMVFLEYKDFNEMYHEFTRYPIYYVDDLPKEDYFYIGQSCHLENVVIKTNGYDFDLDISLLNYTIAKWKMLVKKYVDPKEYEELKQRLVDSTAKSLTFNFNIHKNLKTDKDQTKTRESCIIAMVFTRKKSDGPWTSVNMYYRCMEVFKKGACDLVLLNRMFNELPNLDIKEVIFHIPQPFFSAFILCEIMEGPLFSLSEYKDNDSVFAKKLCNDYNKYYGPDAKLSNYHAIRRKQDLKASGKKLPEIPIDSLVLFEKTESLF